MELRTTREHDHHVRLLLLGDSGVGKTCIMSRFTTDEYTNRHISTIGIDFRVKTVEMGGKKIKIQIWDTAGQERFRAITTAYYRCAMGVVLVFSISNQQSFENIRQWMRDVNMYTENEPDKILVGNKCDLEAERMVSAHTAQNYADSLGIEYIETSAKNDINVKEAFAHLTRRIIRRITENPQFDPLYEINRSNGINVEGAKSDGDEDGRCCSL